MAQQIRAYRQVEEPYLPVELEGIKYLLVPKLSLLEKNLWESELYDQDNNLDILPPRAVNELAKKVRPKKPDEEFIRYARENSNLTDNEVLDAYRQLHEEINGNLVNLIRSKGILIWDAPSHHHRLISDEPLSDELTSILVTDYKIIVDGNKYFIDIRGITPDPRVEVNWPRRDGTITPEIAELLGAEPDTYIWTNPDLHYGEGLRTLVWMFTDERCYLNTLNTPWKYSGSLLGRKLR